MCPIKHLKITDTIIHIRKSEDVYDKILVIYLTLCKYHRLIYVFYLYSSSFFMH